MKYRKLGHTGMKISEVGFGCIPILKGSVSILPNYYGLDDKEALAIMEKAFEYGCNLYDTAVVPEYGDAEIKLGKFLKEHKGEIYISDKARAYTKWEMEKAIQTSLKNLQSDYCDIYFVHQVAPENEEMVYSQQGALQVLADYKRKGYIGAVGIATHHYKMAYRAALDERVDVIQIPGNILERGILDRVESNKAIFNKVGVIVHKAYAAGVLPDFFAPKELIKFVLNYSIDSVLIGMGSIGHVIAATNGIEGKIKISFDEVIDKLGRIYDIIPCTRCQECICPNGIEIESVFRYFNYYNLGHRRWAYNKMVNQIPILQEKCSICINHQCEKYCPQRICISSEIKKILNEFKGGRKIMEGAKLKPGKDYIGVGVGAVILRDNKILLLLRKKAPESGCWTIPGGKVEFGETVEEAILREVKEEINAEGKIIAPLGVTNHILKEEGTHYVSPRFLVELLEEPKNMEPESHEAMEWFPIDNLPENVTMTTQKALSAFLTWNKQKN